MSGFYIKGFLPPKNCDDCYFNCDCLHDQHIDFYKMTSGRPISCPIVPVYEHGDLIDREALKKELGRVCLPDSLDATLGFGAAKQRIDAAPAIIEGNVGKGINVPSKSCYTCFWFGRGEELADYGHCWMHNGEDFEQPPASDGCSDWREDDGCPSLD